MLNLDERFIITFKGCVSQGKDEKEALAKIKAAVFARHWAEDRETFTSLKNP